MASLLLDLFLKGGMILDRGRILKKVPDDSSLNEKDLKNGKGNNTRLSQGGIGFPAVLQPLVSWRSLREKTIISKQAAREVPLPRCGRSISRHVPHARTR